ncbi:MAG: hypothetical protein NZ920_04885 [Aigarchaeota archaeon]|nr:hypothetical protein [Aigarchaeota archaeon]MDW8093273.1 hypothetical protein [Nitrososphaerota archaeon]
MIGQVDFETKLIREGRAVLVVPSMSGSAPPSHLPVFFNPRSKISRDLAVSVTAAFFSGARDLRVIEPLTGLGARVIRLLLEAGVFGVGFASDRNEQAIRLASMNRELNGLTERLVLRRANANLAMMEAVSKGERFDYVDIDPSGSHITYIESGILATKKGGILGVSATDLSALSGVSPTTSEWRYGVQLHRTYVLREVALRTMVCSVIRSAAKLGIAASPILTVHLNHFVRTFVRIEGGITKALDLLRRLGYLSVCPACHEVSTANQLREVIGRCVHCGSEVKPIGPIFLGRLSSPEFCEKLGRTIESGMYRETARLIYRVANELQDIPYYYPLSLIARLSKRSTPSPLKVVQALRDAGHVASLTHLDPTGVKTNATLREVRDLVAGLH